MKTIILRLLQVVLLAVLVIIGVNVLGAAAAGEAF